MNCPKCNHYQQEGYECSRCGIIFSRYYEWLAVKEQKKGLEQKAPAKASVGKTLLSLLFYVNPEIGFFTFIGRVLILLGLVGWSYFFITSPMASNYAGESFLHLVNLPFHEFGHIIFRPLGSFMTSLGGTIFQLLMPLICFAVLLFQTRDTFGAAICLWWFGQNFFDIAPYVNDARSLTLPLVGGNVGHSSPYGFHDWEYILTESGLLQYDHTIAKICVASGSTIFLISLFWGAYILYKQYIVLDR